MKATEYVDIGQYLRDSRESLRVPVAQASAALNIRAKYIRAIESGNLSELPGKAYTRGYIRNYADYLGLNSAEVVSAYEALLGPKEQEFFVPEPTLTQNLPSRGVIRASILGMLLIYGYWYFAIHDRTPLMPNTGEIPQEFLQMLDKSARAGMDKNWESCMDSGDIECFITLRQTAIPTQDTIVTQYDDSLRIIPPQKP